MKNGTDLYEFWQILSQNWESFVISTVRVVLCLKHIRTCLQMPKFIFPAGEDRGSSTCGVSRESWMVLMKVSQHFISCFPLIRAKSYVDVHLRQNLLHLCLIFLHWGLVYCVETQKPNPVWWFICDFLFLFNKTTWTLKNCSQHCLQW